MKPLTDAQLINSIAAILWGDGVDQSWSSDTIQEIADQIILQRPDLYKSFKNGGQQEDSQGQDSGEDLDILTAIDIVEGVDDASPEHQLQAWQQMVNSGLVWKLQGWYQRTAAQLISQGLIQEA